MGIQLGIVGYGGMGGFHHRNASKIEGVQVVGAYDIDPVRVQVAEESGLRGFSSLEDLLACEDINTVLVAVPNDCHMEICIAASNAGKHVICEKPAALNVDELDQMIAAAGRNGKLFTVHQNRRWDKDFRIVKDILDSGELGKVYSIQSRLHGSGGVMFGWRGEKKHGGMLYDWGVHFIDQLMWMLGYDNFRSVFCKTSNVKTTEVEDYFFLVFDLEDGSHVLNSTPFVRQYDIMFNRWGDFNAKGSTKQTIYAGVQENGCRNHEKRTSEYPCNDAGIWN